MTRRTNLALVLALGSIAVADVTAQVEHLVGPGQTYTTIDAAIQAAAPGDVIAVMAGFYWQITCSKSLTIRAEPTGALVQVDAASVQVPVGGHARFCGLRMNNVHVGGVATNGVASFEGCEIRAPLNGFAPALIVYNAPVTLWRCRVADGKGGIRADGSQLAIVQCDVASGGAFYFSGSLSAVDLFYSVAHISGSTLAAGTGDGVAGVWAGIAVGSGSTLDIVDSTVRGGDYVGYQSLIGGPAIYGGLATSHVNRTTLLAGTGTAGPGPSTNVATAPLLGVRIAESIVTPGGTMTVEFRAAPATPIYVLAAFGLKPPASAPFVEPLQWGFTAPDGIPLVAVFTDGAGLANYGLVVPPIPALRNLGVWFTGIEFGQLPGQLSPPVGAVIR